MIEASKSLVTREADLSPAFGTTFLPDGKVRFALWAPTAQQVDLLIHGEPERILPMRLVGDGWHELETDQAKEGTLYNYIIDDNLRVPDPASRFQPEDIEGPSQVMRDHAADYSQSSWTGLPWNETVIYELHVGTFSKEGTFAGVESKLDYLKQLGITAIELMPVADFPGHYNWGYDGVLLFAPDSSYGTPDDLRRLIQAAHDKGMMVFLDVVYNHFGPQGNYLYVYAKRFFNENHHTPWGAAINFDAEFSQYVRQFYIQNVLYWLSEFQFDGLRFDAVHAIMDDSDEHIIIEIAKAVSTSIGTRRHVHLMVENDNNSRKFLVKPSGWQTAPIKAQWNDDIHHALHVLATGEEEGYYADYAKLSSHKTPVEHLARCLSEGFAYQGDRSVHRNGAHRGDPSADLPPHRFVSFIQNHDQVGNRAFGDRLVQLCKPEPLRALTAVFLLNPSIPMLFMGQEFDSTTPFNYFCDMESELGKLITEGRRNEFARFPEFQDEESRKKIPDPLSPSTFQRSKLIWSEAESHRQTLDLYKKLLSLRKQKIVPLIDQAEQITSKVLCAGSNCLGVNWSLPGAQLLLIANLSDKPSDIPPQVAGLIDGDVIYSTHDGAANLPAWCVIWRLANA